MSTRFLTSAIAGLSSRTASVAILLIIATAPCNAKNMVSLNLLNPDRAQDYAVRPYMVQLRQRIQANWHLNRKADRISKVHFQIGRAGDLSGITIEESSGDPVVDRCALNAVAGCSPFPQPPIVQDSLNILAIFRNNQHAVDSGDTNPAFKLHAEAGTETRAGRYVVAAEDTAGTKPDDWVEEEKSPYASTPAETENTTNVSESETQTSYQAQYSREPSANNLAWGQKSTAGWSPSSWSSSQSSTGSGSRKTMVYNGKSDPYAEKGTSNATTPTKTTKRIEGVMKPIPQKDWPSTPAHKARTKELPPLTPTQAVDNISSPPGSGPRKPKPTVPVSVPSFDASKLAIGSLTPKEDFPWWLLIATVVIGAMATYAIRACGFRDCPFCAEQIKKAAIVCKHCSASIEDGET